MTGPAQTLACPSWCMLNDDCKGDHEADVFAYWWDFVTPQPHREEVEVKVTPTWWQDSGAPAAEVTISLNVPRGFSIPLTPNQARAMGLELLRVAQIVERA